MVERKLFLQIQGINIVYPNLEDMIVMPIAKRMKITMSNKVYPISRMNFDYTKNGGGKLFLQIESINTMYPNEENMIIVPITRRMEIVMSIQVCLI